LNPRFCLFWFSVDLCLSREQESVTEIELEKFRAKLLEQKAALAEMDDVGDEAARPIELDQSRMGRLSRIDALQGQQMAQEIERRRQRRLVAIAGALQRIESGEFGQCFVCGEQIDDRRLSADPVITRCITCASA
jgi:DnaK suppressor protein